MSSNSGFSKDSSEQGANQAPLKAFVEHNCNVCGRPFKEENRSCHPKQSISSLRCLATDDWLFPDRRDPTSTPYPTLCGSDDVRFEPLYTVFGENCGFCRGTFEFPMDPPFNIRTQPWIIQTYDKYHLTGELTAGVPSASEAIEQRISQGGEKVTPARVFAHLVFLDQYGVLPGYERLKETSDNLRDWCKGRYDVPVTSLDSRWVVERRVDRSKVYSTTPEFRTDWGLDFEIPSGSKHPHADRKPFCGTAVFEDHRDHNLVTEYAANELHRLPYVDWTTAPHIVYLRAGYDPVNEGTEQGPVLSLDFAGFCRKHDGDEMTYLGVVTDWEESLYEIYLQLGQIRQTTATGLLIFPNREKIYDFLLYLAQNELLEDPDRLPTSRADYLAIPNIQELHQQLLHQIPLFDGVAVYPRRKLMNEGFEKIDDLVQVPTYG
jgi:hypothetical protein